MKLPFMRNDSPASIIFGLASVVGLIFTVVYTIVSLYNNEFGVGPNSVIITLAVVNSILGSILYIQSTNHYTLITDKSESTIKGIKYQQSIKDLEAELDNKDEINNEIAFIFHNIHDQLRDKMHALVELYESLLLDGSKVAEYSEVMDVLRITKSYNLYVVNNTKDLFDKLTGSNTSVCIKLINGFADENDPIIATLIRDTRSYRYRRSNESLATLDFLWHENTAFKTILSNSYPNSYYASNDLAKESGYVNINQNWQRFYKSTLVCPIRLGISDECNNNLDESVIGFICVDNMEGGLDESACIDALSSIADSLYLYFTYNEKILNLVQKRNIPEGETSPEG